MESPQPTITKIIVFLQRNLIVFNLFVDLAQEIGIKILSIVDTTAVPNVFFN
jgi:hypothetical protein